MCGEGRVDSGQSCVVLCCFVLYCFVCRLLEHFPKFFVFFGRKVHPQSSIELHRCKLSHKNPRFLKLLKRFDHDVNIFQKIPMFFGISNISQVYSFFIVKQIMLDWGGSFHRFSSFILAFVLLTLESKQSTGNVARTSEPRRRAGVVSVSIP